MTDGVAELTAGTRLGETAVQRLVRIATETLPPELAHLAAGPLAESLGKAVDFARDSLSERTQKTYLENWTAFQSWCDANKAPALPTVPAIIAAYLADRSEKLGRSGLRLALAAISHYHRRAGHLSPTSGPVVASVMQGILRKQQRATRPAAALGTPELKKLISTCDNNRTGKAGFADLRDRALLLTCFAGGLRRSELVALDREDVSISADGMVLKILRSKADQEGQGATVKISRGMNPSTCPVRAMAAWLKAGAITYGPVFRRITASGAIEGRLTGNGVWKILRRRAEQAGLTVDEGERLSPHGMRAGFITEAYLNGALDEQVMAHARQKNVDTTRRYRNRAKTVAASPTKLLDL
jgi:integrase